MILVIGESDVVIVLCCGFWGFRDGDNGEVFKAAAG